MEPFVSLLLRCWLVSINFIIDFKITHSLEDEKGLMYGMNLRVSAFEVCNVLSLSLSHILNYIYILNVK